MEETITVSILREWVTGLPEEKKRNAEKQVICKILRKHEA